MVLSKNGGSDGFMSPALSPVGIPLRGAPFTQELQQKKWGHEATNTSALEEGVTLHSHMWETPLKGYQMGCYRAEGREA